LDGSCCSSDFVAFGPLSSGCWPLEHYESNRKSEARASSDTIETRSGHFDNLDKTYGPLGGAIGLYLGFYLSGFAILVGGKINFLLGELRNQRTPQSFAPSVLRSTI
jgi:hypothetical protein